MQVISFHRCQFFSVLKCNQDVDSGNYTLEDDTYFDNCFWFMTLARHATNRIEETEIPVETHAKILETLERLKITVLERTGSVRSPSLIRYEQCGPMDLL
jgi:hypothetical protein